MLAVWLAVCAVLVRGRSVSLEQLKTEMCVNVAEAALWDDSQPQKGSSSAGGGGASDVPSSLSPALRGDRVLVAGDVKGPQVLVTAKSFFPRFVWVATDALAPCADEAGSKTFLAAEVARARELVVSLRSEVVACAEAHGQENGCEGVQDRLLSAMDDLKRLCDADPDCKAARKKEKKSKEKEGARSN
jgi:hypothetical protein